VLLSGGASPPSQHSISSLLFAHPPITEEPVTPRLFTDGSLPSSPATTAQRGSVMRRKSQAAEFAASVHASMDNATLKATGWVQPVLLASSKQMPSSSVPNDAHADGKMQ
jgi:hypothetical protein